MIGAERKRQTEGIELIASENYVSDQVMEAMGSVLTNKYAEGYPGARYYGGCEVVDRVETLAIERVCRLYGAEYANVQPHSGAQANMAVFFAVLKPGDTFMGLDLAHGGHLSHGSAVNMSGMYFNAVGYQLNEQTGTIDYEDMERKALEHRPKLIIGGASAYSREWDYKRMREIADKVGALLLIDMAHTAGLIAAGLLDNPREIRPYRHLDDAQDAARPGAEASSSWARISTIRGATPRPKASSRRCRNCSTRPSSPAFRAARSNT